MRADSDTSPTDPGGVIQHFIAGARLPRPRGGAPTVYHVYGALGDSRHDARLHRDLRRHLDALPGNAPSFAGFVAIFPDATASSEADFRAVVAGQLETLLHRDGGTSARPEPSDGTDMALGITHDVILRLAGRTLSVTGLYPGADRHTLRAPYEALVFIPL